MGVQPSNRMVSLTGIDIAFIIVYLVAVIAIASWRSKNAQDEDFLIANRKMGVLGALSSINATKTGSILLIYVALLYLYGFSAIWYFLGVAAGYLIFIPFGMKLHRNHAGSHYTMAEYFFHGYGKSAGYCTSLLNIFLVVAFLVLNLIASSKVVSFFTGISFELSTVIVLGVVLAYLLIGGFKAVVTTDILQYFAIIFVLVVFAIFLLGNTTIPAADWNLTKAGIANVVGFFLLGILLPFADPSLWQRVYASKTEKTLKQGIFYSVIIYVIFAFVLSLIGLAIKASLPAIDPDIALVQGFATLLPAGLMGLSIVVFFAAFMSSIDTYVFTAASSFVHDFFKNDSKRQAVKRIQIAAIGITIIGGLVAILIKDLVLGAYIFASFGVLMAIPILLTWMRPSVKGVTISVGIVLSTVLLCVLTAYYALGPGFEATIVLKAIGISLVSLVIGGVASTVTR
jgi:SSS family solute:Na+ symporter